MWTYCMLHRDYQMSEEFADVMDSVVKALHFLKGSALQTCLFTSLCAAVGEEHTCFIILRCVGFLVDQCCCWFELHTSIHKFLLKHYAELAAEFRHSTWLTKPAYLAGFFSELMLELLL